MPAVDILPLSTSAYIADTQHLSLPQHGAYLLILMTMWRAGGWIDDDDRKLANICKLSTPKWLRIGEPVRSLLIKQDGKLSQKRLLSEIESELKRISNNRLNGKKGGEAKALKSKESHLATARNSAEPRQNSQKSPLPSSSLLFDSKVPKEGRKKRKSGISLPDDWVPSGGDVEYGLKLGLQHHEIESMAEDLRLWAKANANRAVGRKANWSAAFQGWMRRDRPKVSNGVNGHGKRGTDWTAIARDLAESDSKYGGGGSAPAILPRPGDDDVELFPPQRR